MGLTSQIWLKLRYVAVDKHTYNISPSNTLIVQNLPDFRMRCLHIVFGENSGFLGKILQTCIELAKICI